MVLAGNASIRRWAPRVVFRWKYVDAHRRDATGWGRLFWVRNGKVNMRGCGVMGVAEAGVIDWIRNIQLQLCGSVGVTRVMRQRGFRRGVWGMGFNAG